MFHRIHSGVGTVHVDAAQINARFHREPYHARWTADGVLADAGLLIHIFDRWEARRQDGSYMFWRSNPGIQMSASLVYSDQRPDCCPGIPIPAFDKSFAGLQGLIFRPGVTTRIICGTAGDRSGGRCDDASHWCDSIPVTGDQFDPHVNSTQGADGCGGTWRPEDFGVYLRRSCMWEKEVQAPWSNRLDYNEILVDGSHWTEHLPDTVEAFFGNGNLAREQHGQFLREYGLTASQVPLLHLNEHNWKAPFSDSR